MSFEFRAERTLPMDIVADVEKNAAYVSARLRSLRVLADRVTIRVECDPEHDDDLRATAIRFMHAMTAQYRTVAPKVVAKTARRAATPLVRDVNAELIRRGWLVDLGPGQMGFSGPALGVWRALERVIGRIARQFNATDHSYPSLIPANVLARCGYFGSFPQSVSLVTHLAEDFDGIEGFRRANVDSTVLQIPDPSIVRSPDMCLVPAACYHAYQALEGTVVPDDGLAITTLAKCFRYESSNMVGIERLWDFTMREIILLGSENSVRSRRADAIEAVKHHLEEWDLEGSIESATDAFFPTTYATKAFWQLARDTKFEVRLAIEPARDDSPRSLACGSLNLAGNLFGHVFGIKTADGAPAFTGCIGWGYERWALAVFTQHGFDVARWPTALQNDLER